MRRCTVKGANSGSVPAVFHQWCNISQLVDAGLTIGSHPAGVVSYTVGLVELKTGEMSQVDPNRIIFDKPWEGMVE